MPMRAPVEAAYDRPRGGFTGPYILGVLSRHGFAVPMYVLGGCNLAAACILLSLHVPPKPAKLRRESAGSLARDGSAEEALRQGQECSAALTQAN